MVHLSHPALFHQSSYINGQWVTEGLGTSRVTNPADGSLVGTVPNVGGAGAKAAVEAAAAAFPAWKGKTAKERAAILRKWYELILANVEDLARLMTMEQGKPLTESRNEVRYAASFIEWYAEEGKRVYGETIPATATDRRVLVLREPVGVCAAITPWNFPASMVTRKTAPALAVGCTVVLKPSELTPFSALAMAALAEEAGMPPGVFNVITGKASEIGKELTENPLVRKLSFTGSTEIGKLLYAQCADTVKKLSLELGGNAPFIVFDDADLDLAAKGVLASRYRNAGQTCVCANRIMVHESVHDAFVAKVVAGAQAMKAGNGLEEGVVLGPLVEEVAVQKVERLLREAVAAGAVVKTGGKRIHEGGLFFEPTVVCGVKPEMSIAREEIFGPVTAVMTFKTEAEAIRMANDTEYGLAAYYFSRDVGRVMRVMEALEYGLVGVNEGVISTEVAPFGGYKQSGIGREGGHFGVDEFLEVKYVCVGGLT